MKTVPLARPVRSALAAMLALELAACSVVGMKRAPSSPDSGEVIDCTSSWTLPLADMGGAVITGSAAVLLLSQASSEDNDPDGSPTPYRVAGWSSLGLAVLFIASGAYGTVQRARCQNAQEQGIGPARPQWKEEATPPPGSLGASCQADEECGDDLVCDEPMKT